MNDRILLTGARRGLGLAMTRKLLQQGHYVCALVRDPSEGLKALATEHSDRLRIALGDVTDDSAITSVMQSLASDWGSLDVVINNAVIYLDGSGPPLEEVDLSIFAKTFEVNTVGPLRIIQKALPLLRQGKRKLIVNISSEAGSIGDCWRKAEYAYSMSKTALNMGSRIVQNAVSAEGITVLAVHPGWFNSSGQGPAPISAEQAAAPLLDTLFKPRTASDPMFIDPAGKPLPW